MKKVLLDTNAYSHLLKGDKTVLQQLEAAEEVYMSVIVLAELYTGFKGGIKETENKAYLKRFLNKPMVRKLNSSEETAIIFAEIKHQLKTSGKPIPIHDVWIAAHTMETGSVLITYDKHFTYVAGLRLWDAI